MLTLIANSSSASYMQIDGLVSVNGAKGSATCPGAGGGGAGGSLAIDAFAFSGHGTLQALGGAGGKRSVAQYSPLADPP